MLTLSGKTEYSEEIKKSKFIVKAKPITTSEEALSYRISVQDLQASHNCWAYKIGQDYRFSDDGEPAGTAGKPILNAIERQGLDQVVVIVTRFFGGIKLGAGGLIRAYGGTAAKCLKQAKKEKIINFVYATLKVGFQEMGSAYLIIDQFGAQKIEEEYTPQGLTLTIAVEETFFTKFQVELNNACSGKVELEQKLP